jgi:hypothetical protein
MYELPEKFTGINSEPIDIKDFKSLCYALEGMDLGKVLSVKGYEYPNNYYVTEIQDDTGIFNVYLNCFVGVMAFGISVENSNIKFIQKPQIESVLKFINKEYYFLPLDVLNSDVQETSLKQLNIYERDEIKFWLPATHGQLLFSSYFD